MHANSKFGPVRRALAAAVVGVALAASGSAVAQNAPPSDSPAQILQQNPSGGADMIRRLREFAVSNPSGLPQILALLPNANREQKAAIGSALAQAARIVVRTNQGYAAQIQQSIVESRDQDLQVAYLAVAGDVQLGGVGGGPAGGAGGGGAVGGQTNPLGGQVTGGGSAQPIGAPGTATGAFSYTSSVTAAGGVSTTSTVSP